MNTTQPSSTNYTRFGQPHYQGYGNTFSVTLSAHDAVPKAVMEKFLTRRKAVLLEIDLDQKPEKENRKMEIWRKSEFYLEQQLNKRHNQEHPLKPADSARKVAKVIHKHDGVFYDLLAYAIMSNHIHLLLDFSVQCPRDWDGVSRPVGYVNLSTVIGRIKGGSTYEVNKIKGRSSTLWSHGYFDRYIRNQAHFINTLLYVTKNIEAAGLAKRWEDHPFTYVKPELIELIRG